MDHPTERQDRPLENTEGVDLGDFFGHCLHVNPWSKDVWRGTLHRFECCRCDKVVIEGERLSMHVLPRCKGGPVKEGHAPRENILICASAGDERLSVGVASFLVEAVNRNAAPGRHKFSVFFASGIRGYAKMRNTCVKMFLASPCSRLWFVDDDVLPPKNVFDLLDVDADVAVAPYPWVGSLRPMVMNLKDVNDPSKGLTPPTGSETIQNITGCAMGCTIIRRAVLEDERMRFPTKYTDLSVEGRVVDQADEPDALPPVFRFHLKPDGSTLTGEDLDFGLRATRLGYTVKMHLGIPVDHLKSIGLNRARQILEVEAEKSGLAQIQRAIHVR